MSRTHNKVANPEKYTGKEYLSYEESTDFLGVSLSTLARYVTDEEITTHKFYRDKKKYLAMGDVNLIEDLIKNPWKRKAPLPIAENAESVPVEEKAIPAIPQQSNPQIRNVARSEELPTSQPSGTIKRGEFVETYGISNGPFGKWLENGLGDDRLEVTHYTNEKNRPSHCFTPEQLAHNIEVLKRHGKLK